MAEVTEINPGKPTETEDSTDQTTSDQTTRTPKNKGGRPTKDKQRPPEARQPQFFDRIAAVPREDWGTRAFMYVYADEPVCRAKTFGTTRYLLKSSVPIHDLEGLKLDYGSFKGWMSLNLRKTGKDATDEVDRLDFEIYDPKFPPKIPRAAWANDDRNARWIALLPPEAPPANAAAASLLEGARFYKDMREDLKEELGPTEPQQTRTSEVLETMKAAKDLFAPVSQANNATPAKDPLELATALFTIMNQTKADNPAIDMYRDELKAAREEMKEMRAAALAQATSPSTQPKSLVDQAVELAGAVEKLSPLKALFGLGGNGAVAETVRAGRTGWLDVARDLGGKFFDSDLATGVGQYLASIAQRNAGGPMQPNPATNGQPQVQQRDEAAAFDAFIREVVNPTLLRQYSRGFGGDEFAGWMFDAFPDRLKQLQTLTHQRMPGQKGAPVIIAAYQNLYPDTYKPLIAQREGEASFAQFVNEFCAWKPEKEQQEPIDAIPVEQDGEEAPERI
jgi:hypothetical protein